MKKFVKKLKLAEKLAKEFPSGTLDNTSKFLNEIKETNKARHIAGAQPTNEHAIINALTNSDNNASNAIKKLETGQNLSSKDWPAIKLATAKALSVAKATNDTKAKKQIKELAYSLRRIKPQNNGKFQHK